MDIQGGGRRFRGEMVGGGGGGGHFGLRPGHLIFDDNLSSKERELTFFDEFLGGDSGHQTHPRGPRVFTNSASHQKQPQSPQNGIVNKNKLNNGGGGGQQQQQQQQQQQTNNGRYKTELCRPFEEFGTCKYGEKCQFAHGQRELRNVSRHPKYKTELCRTFHTMGLCPYGHRCHFVHESPAKRALNNSESSGSNKSSSSGDGEDEGATSEEYEEEPNESPPGLRRTPVSNGRLHSASSTSSSTSSGSGLSSSGSPGVSVNGFSFSPGTAADKSIGTSSGSSEGTSPVNLGSPDLEDQLINSFYYLLLLNGQNAPGTPNPTTTFAPPPSEPPQESTINGWNAF